VALTTVSLADASTTPATTRRFCWTRKATGSKRYTIVPEISDRVETVMYRILVATAYAAFLLTSALADDERWYACEEAVQCEWVIGEGGWPAAVRTDSVQAYKQWIQSQAPFTSYFTPGDCFKRDEEFQTFVLESKTRTVCTNMRCVLDIAPECTR